MLGVRRSDRLKVNAFPAVAHPPDESFEGTLISDSPAYVVNYSYHQFVMARF
jgi:hypothetical protein